MKNPIPVLLLVGLVSACSILSAGTDETRFAVLASVDEMQAAGPGGGGSSARDAKGGVATPAESPARAPIDTTVGLGPVRLPDYVLRNAIVTRVGGTRLVPSETERWAEPLDRAVERVLAQDLARELGVGGVTHWPWYENERPRVQVAITFSRFEREESGSVVLAARWSVRALDGRSPQLSSETRSEHPTGSPDGASTALALSRALAELCGEIATAWREAQGD